MFPRIERWMIRYCLPDDGSGSGGAGGGGEDKGSGGAGEGNSGEGSQDDPAKKALESERTARKAAEKSVRDLQARLDEIDSKDKSELEKTQGELKKAQDALELATNKARETTAKSALIAEATNGDALRPEAVYKIVKDDVEFDDDGNVTNAATLIQQAKKDAPELFRVKQGGGGNGGARDAEGGDKGTFGVTRLASAYAESGKKRKSGN